MEEGEKEHCKRCGIAIYQFSKKYSVSANDYYCVKCAEKIDREYLVKNSCSVCGRLLKKYEIKFVLPSKAYGSDSPLPVSDRLVCSDCHTKLSFKQKQKMPPKSGVDQVRAGIRKMFFRRMLQKVQEAVPQTTA